MTSSKTDESASALESRRRALQAARAFFLAVGLCAALIPAVLILLVWTE